MKVNDKEIATESQTLTELLAELHIDTTLIAVERNRVIVPRSEYAHTSLEEEDTIEIIHAVGGG